ncbi:MAG: hypothetical protein RIS83_2221 [Pseudomonadota bacterium]|jgi:FkbM family methyltransferase
MRDVYPSAPKREWGDVVIEGKNFRVAGDKDDIYFKNLDGAVSSLRLLAPLAEAVVARDSTILDVGANIGIATLMLANKNPNGKLYAFEPIPQVVDHLRATITEAALHHVDIIQTAIGDRTDRVAFHLGSNFSAGSHIVTQSHISVDSTPTHLVPMNTIDEFARRFSVQKIDLIKIDTEGFEREVILGAKNCLERFKPVVFLEMNSWCLLAFRNMNPREFVEFLLAQFPKVFWVDHDKKLHPLKQGSGFHHFLHEHLVRHGCVTDLVCCSDDGWLSSFGAGRIEN